MIDFIIGSAFFAAATGLGYWRGYRAGKSDAKADATYGRRAIILRARSDG